MGTRLLSGLTIEIEGEGDAMLCIHGLGGSSNTWTPVIPSFDEYKLVRPDLPGSARSELPVQKLTIASYVQAMERLLTELQIDTVHITAHSLGTIVAQHFAVRNTTKVKSLALLGPLLAPPDAARPNILARAKLARSGLPGIQEIADTIVQGATSAETKTHQPAVLALVRESLMRQTPEAYAQSCEALAEAEAATIDDIRIPTLLVTGDEDGVAPVASVQAMAERIKGSRVVVINNCGHWTPFEKPHECITALREFHAECR